MPKLTEFQSSTMDWRDEIRRNQNRTFYVIFLFIIIYTFIGLLIDVYLNYIPGYPLTYEYINSILFSFITLKTIPTATIIMFSVAIVALMVTYAFHDQIMMMGTDYIEVTSDSKGIEERRLYNVVEELKIASGLRFMPKVYIIEADYMNAFASGFSERSAMVAITRGLMEKLDRDELQAVMGHELSHVRHNDIRLTLTVAVLSNIMLIALDLVFRGALYGNGRNRDNRLILVIVLIRFILPIITLLLMLYLSRTREYMADAGSVELLRSNEPMARALIKIHEDHQNNQEAYARAYENTPHEEVRQTAYFYDPAMAGISVMKSINTLFSTHPSLEDRLKALGYEPKNPHRE